MERLGITFRHTLRRDPFLFVSSGLLLRMLYAITRPGGQTTTKLRPVVTFEPAKTFVAYSGERWGNDVVDSGPKP